MKQRLTHQAANDWKKEKKKLMSILLLVINCAEDWRDLTYDASLVCTLSLSKLGA